MASKTVLAVDLGAESGRVMAVQFDGRALHLQELHRFPNPVVTVQGTLHWDFLYLWREIQAGIEKGKTLQPAAIGVATWGVDFGLLDKQGRLIGNPVHYRDGRTAGMMEAVLAKVPRHEIFAQTGIQFMPINTLYQMMSLVVQQSPQLSIAATFLTAPDLLNYWLTGVKVCEFSNATTTQMFSPTTGTWAFPLLEKVGIPPHIFPEIVRPGTLLGQHAGVSVIAPACHDTGSAVAAVPTQMADFAYVSTGTWCLVGLEVERPVLTEAALAANVTNEGGVNNTYRLLKNVMGLWILQQCRAEWERQGTAYAYGRLVQMAAAAPPLEHFIDPNDSIFLPPGDHPQRIRDYCRQSGQAAPESIGAIVRCVLESLALAYRAVLAELAAVSGCRITALHLVGGGIQNELLSQMTADATGLPVVAGPIEATVMGNALVQLMALGEIENLNQGRQIVAESTALQVYRPQHTAEWDDAYQRYQALIQK